MDSKYRGLKKNDTTGYLKKKKKEQWQILTQAPPPGDLTYKGFFFLWIDDMNLLTNNSVPRDDFWKRIGPFSITDGMSYALHWGLKKKKKKM